MPGQVIDLAAYRGARRSVHESTVDIALLPWLWPAWATWVALSTLAWWKENSRMFYGDAKKSLDDLRPKIH